MRTLCFFTVLACSILTTTLTIANDGITTTEWRDHMEELLPIAERLEPLLAEIEDPLLRAEFYRHLYAHISAAYHAVVQVDRRYPEFWPLTNNTYNFFSMNPDNSYHMAPVDGDGVYKISGVRGTTRIVFLSFIEGTLMSDGVGSPGKTLSVHDIDDIEIDEDGTFEIVVSNERPKGYKGNWWRLDPAANWLLIRQMAYDWLNEVDGRYAIERLDVPAIRPRLSEKEIHHRLTRVADATENWTRFELGWMQRLHDQDLVNKLIDYPQSDVGGVESQNYVAGLYELQDDEALIYETKVPDNCRYWSVQLTDGMWRTLDYVSRQSSLNGHTARIDSDGKFRAVISARDPGVPNWLDTADYSKGSMQSRWLGCNEFNPHKVSKVKLIELGDHLPLNTPAVSAEERDASIRLRRKAYQLRHRW
jgi:Protein of unknown function (DUF1214)